MDNLNKNRSFNSQKSHSDIVLYQSEDGTTQLEVKLQGDTVWLTQAQMSELFQMDRTVIVRHIHNIYKDEELQEKETCVKNAQVRKEGKKIVTRQIPFYNLDMIISVGYRVNAKRGVAFRKWATSVLRQYVVKGYAINNHLHKQQLNDLRQIVQVLSRTSQNQTFISNEESQALFDVVTDYTYALDMLDNYDYQRLTLPENKTKETFHITYDLAIEQIRLLKEKFNDSSLFGIEKDDSFKSSIGQIYQTFDGQELYPSVEEKAAMLLYLITKNHSFSDGNKRIAATIFLWFMNANNILYNTYGSKRISDSTLVALTLMIAESRPEEKDVMMKVVVNLISDK